MGLQDFLKVYNKPIFTSIHTLLSQGKKILFIVPYPTGKAPSQRFRFEQYYNFLTESGFEFKTEAFLSDTAWQYLYQPGHYLKKVSAVLQGFLKRLLLLFAVHRYDFIFIHREATPVGLPWFEWFVAKVIRKKIIYDFDDAIWLSNTSSENKVVSWIKFHRKTAFICRWAYKVSVGNSYLGDYARQFNSSVVFNPTTIDTDHHYSILKHKENRRLVIGWTGSHSTLKYLDAVVPVLKKLETDYDFETLVIADKNPHLALKDFHFVKWKKDSEIQDLNRIDIGIMPLSDNQWTRGKCGFKALQYMALGIPCVVSGVGANLDIVSDRNNGMIANSSEEWKSALVTLLNDEALRKRLGNAGKVTLEQGYSVRANSANFIKLFS